MKKKLKKIILATLISAGIISGGVVLRNSLVEPELLTVHEWRALAEIYNEEAKGGLKIGHVKNRADILNRLDEKILEKTKKREKDYRNLTEGLIYKRNPKLR